MNATWTEKLYDNLRWNASTVEEPCDIIDRLREELPKFMDEYALAVANDKELQDGIVTSETNVSPLDR